MIDLHTHTFFSDGVLIPSELVVRAKKAGYEAIALTDHGDFSNMDFIIPRIAKAAIILARHYNIAVLPGIELSYIPPALISKAANISRKLGAKIVLVHGESPVECVPCGTNLAAINSGIDIVAHPGFITKAESAAAFKKGVSLEITTRNGHNRGNKHVAKMAGVTGANLVFNTDTHIPENLMNKKIIKETLELSFT
jgi:putative hydrolase